MNLNEISHSIIIGDYKKAPILTKKALDEGISANQILSEGLISGIRTVGDRFSRGEYFLPELMISGKAMEAALEYLRPALISGEAHYAGKYLIGTVKDDVHDIGKNIVIMMLEGNGWQVTDLGVDVSPEKFCIAVKEGEYDILGMSALLSITMPNLEKTIQALKSAGLRQRINIMVGGAPVTSKYAERIGADAYGKDAFEAVTEAVRLMGMK
jgi:5-methyltetrahydrofolate--homocysteine methyltransferase